MHLGQIIAGIPVNGCFPGIAVWFPWYLYQNIGTAEKNYGQQAFFDISLKNTVWWKPTVMHSQTNPRSILLNIVYSAEFRYAQEYKDVVKL